MAIRPPDSERRAGTESASESSPGTPLWVIILAVAVIALILLFVILHFTVGGAGPGLHAPSSAAVLLGARQPWP